MLNLSAFVAYHARIQPERLALIYADQRITYRVLDERIQALSALLVARRVQPGQVVAVLMRNSAAFVELSIAVGRIGAVFLPINFRLAADEISYICGNTAACLLFADAEFQSVVATLPQTILVDAAAQSDSRRLARPDMPVPTPVARGPDDLFRLMYTSGTTDRPKGVMHSYDNFYWKCMDHVLALGLSREERLLVVGPLYHVGAYDLPGMAVLWVGGTICIQRDFDPEAVLAAIAQERLTGVWLAPVMTGRILEVENPDRFDLSSLRWSIGGGEKTPEARIRAFSGVFRNARYIDGYGLTESCSGDTLMEAGREIEKIGSTGRATPHVEIEIRDDSGRTLGAGIEGEICLRGPKITKGYWKDPEKTRASFHGDWFRTGDVGYLDEEGFLYLTDRKKDMIISGGENIASSEVERVIYQLPGVSEVAVVGAIDERWGERAVAIVVLRSGSTLDYERLAQHCRAKLAAFKVPKELHLRADLPRNPSGKVLKRVLRDQLAAKGER